MIHFTKSLLVAICVFMASNLFGQAISGEIKTFFPDGAPIPNVSLCVDKDECVFDSGCEMTLSDANGTFSFTPTWLSNSFVTATKQVVLGDGDAMDSELCGINAYDIHLIRKHVLAVESITDVNRLRAADVNGSGNISTLDLLRMHMALLNRSFSLVNLGWFFTDASIDYNDPTNPGGVGLLTLCVETDMNNSEANFIGVKYGDVDATCGLAEQFVSTIDLNLTDLNVPKGEHFVVSMKPGDFTDLVAYQMGIQFDPDYMDLVEVRSGDLESPVYDYYYGLDEVDQGVIRTLWLSEFLRTGESLALGEAVFRLEFVAKRNISALSNHFNLEDQVLKNRAWNKDGELLKLETEFAPTPFSINNVEDTKRIVDDKNEDSLRPRNNPFRTAIGFDMNTSSNQQVELELINMLGHKVLAQSFNLSEGYNYLELSELSALSNGYYYYRMKSQSGMLSGLITKE